METPAEGRKQLKVTAVVTERMKDAIRELADGDRRSEGDIVRLALERYIADRTSNVQITDSLARAVV
jgi:hypothetical protein